MRCYVQDMDITSGLKCTQLREYCGKETLHGWKVRKKQGYLCARGRSLFECAVRMHSKYNYYFQENENKVVAYNSGCIVGFESDVFLFVHCV